MKPFDPNVMEKLAESDDHANFIQNSIEMLLLNILKYHYQYYEFRLFLIKQENNVIYY